MLTEGAPPPVIRQGPKPASAGQPAQAKRRPQHASTTLTVKPSARAASTTRMTGRKTTPKSPMTSQAATAGTPGSPKPAATTAETGRRGTRPSRPPTRRPKEPRQPTAAPTASPAPRGSPGPGLAAAPQRSRASAHPPRLHEEVREASSSTGGRGRSRSRERAPSRHQASAAAPQRSRAPAHQLRLREEVREASAGQAAPNSPAAGYCPQAAAMEYHHKMLPRPCTASKHPRAAPSRLPRLRTAA
mmetsp:Transcript_54546/g.168899  ORF Transcript_54546/g.168899 Transcript_54546/m.168899 type:complete len:245 (-) Transcript_54546:178-912(-)